MQEAKPVSTHAISYDDLPYTNLPFAQTHPDRIAALATLFGLEPVPLDRCRVLELGCAAAGNLIAMAVTMPHAQFVGIDLSERQIADGRATVGALGLPNVDLRAMSIMDVDERLGEFDYIIAHGVYSWVPDDVQARTLELCSRRLSANGIAFISYNALPGWHARGVIRDLMRYHAEQFPDPHTKVQHARAIGDFLAASLTTDTPYKAAVTSQIESLRGEPDTYIAHEYLEATNDPLYFHQFVERAKTHRLQYLADADFGTMLASNFPPQIEQRLLQLAPDVIRQEQYMDFLRNRSFRQTLLVHEDRVVDRKLGPQRLRRLFVSGSFEPEGPAADWDAAGIATFRGAQGARLHTGNVVTRAAAIVLSERWPTAIRFDELLREAIAHLRAPAASEAKLEATLAADVLRCVGAGLVQLYVRPSSFARAVDGKPRASPLARLQAQRELRVTNLRHEPVQLNSDVARLIQLLDGTRTRDEIVRITTQWATANAAVTGRPIPADAARFVGDVVDQTLAQLARSALLTAAD